MKRIINNLFRATFFLTIPIIVAGLVFSGQPANCQSSTGNLKAGAARIDITPSLPVKLYGYSSRKNYSEGVHDKLYARIVVLENGSKHLVMISSDLGSYSEELFPVIRQQILERFGLEESELFLSTVHSHSSPVLTLNSETGDPNNIRYTELLIQKLISATGEAFNNLSPARVGLGRGHSPVGSNRREMRSDGSVVLGRNPYGPADKEVLVMRISDSDGSPVAALYNYATHSTSLGPANMQISGDILGISAQFVEKILGNEIVSPVFAGASGNIDPWYRVLPGFNEEPGWIPEPVLLGTLLGVEVIHVYRNMKEINPGGEIMTLTDTVELPRRKREGDPEGLSSTVPVRITAARVGDAAFIGFNLEMLTEIGMAIKDSSPFTHTFVITHCNGASGYIAPAELYKEGGYEVTSSRFGIGSAETLVKRATRLLYRLYD